MRILRRASALAGSREPARNDPCPCGSGRKFKHCCAGKQASVPRPEISASGPPELEAIREARDAGRLLEAARQAESYTLRHPIDARGQAELGMVHFYAGRAAEALHCLMQAVRLAPETAAHHRNAGFALAQLGRDPEAITAFQRAVALNPSDAEALDQLGVLLMSHGQRAEAIDCFRGAAAAEPTTPLGQVNRAKVLFEEGNSSEGEALLRWTIAQHPANAQPQRVLATVFREQGRFDEAIPLLETATEGSPNQAATAYSELALSKRITDDDQLMLQQMRTLLEYRPLSRIGRQRLHFGLGKAMDDLGNYQAAMRHFDAGNRIVAAARPFDRAHFGASVERLINSTTAESFQTQPAARSTSELPVLILGMPRSGTTLVEQIVSSHPEVVGGDELSFWNRAAEEFGRLGDAGMSTEHCHQVVRNYEATLHEIGPEAARVTDKMPGNYLWIGLFHLLFPNGRIIHCRRNPVDTCLSNYFADFSSPLRFAYDKGDLAFYYRCYRRLMRHWRDILAPGVMLEVDYEELVADPERITRRMIEFVGLEWNEACLRPQDNRRSVKTASNWQARQPTYRTSTERWRRYEPWLGELRVLLDDDDASDQEQPVSSNAKIPIARRLRDAGRYDEAVAMLRDALRQSPNDAVLYSDVGTVCLLSNQVELAVDCFERAIGLCPHFATAHYNLGAALERQGRTAEAIAEHHRAIALSPHMGQAHSRLGNLLHAQGERDEALACFRRALSLFTNPADQDLEEAKLLRAAGHHAEAEPKLRAVIAADPANSLAHAMLGDLLAEQGEFDEAMARMREATDLDPNRAGAWHNLVMVKKADARDRPMLDDLEALLQRPGRSVFDRIILNFALGKAHDDLGEYAVAIAHFDAGNQLEHARLAFDRIAFAANVDRLIETFTPEFFARHSSIGTASELPLLIVGMPRSGTTLVEQIVSAHGQVGARGELSFWSEQAARQATAAPPAGMASNEGSGGAPRVMWDTVPGLARDYLVLLGQVSADAVRMTDKNPFNFLHIGLIHLALPGARFIHCRRDPIDTCLSLYFTRFATPQPFAYDRGDLVFYYRQYERLMAHWRDVLPAERMFEMDYEELTADPEPRIKRMLEFCGLDWDDACLSPERNQHPISTASLWQARQPIYRGSVGRWRNYQPWLGELRDLCRGMT
jgi:tetratricopeptide (TPR) repeat protein